MKRTLLAADGVMLGWFAFVTVVVAVGWSRIQSPWIYLVVHAGVAVAVFGTAWIEARRPSAAARFLHQWLPILVVSTAFFEIKFLVPDVHPFADRAFDHALAATDARWFGDVRGALRHLQWGPFVDALSLCYWSYYPLPLVVCGLLYARGEAARFRQCVTVFLVAWFLSYAGYFLVPAVGPHHVVDGPRDAGLDGWLVSGWLHRTLVTLEGEMPDAFPSGHSLIAMVAILLAWRHQRRQLVWLGPVAGGLIAATMVLRYHYLVDVVAAAALVAPSVAAGTWLAGRWERRLSAAT